MSFPLLPLTSVDHLDIVKEFSIIGSALIEVTSTSEVSTATSFISSNFGLVDFSVLVKSIAVDEQIRLLDAGASLIFTENATELVEAGVPESRLVSLSSDYPRSKGILISSSTAEIDTIVAETSKTVLKDGSGNRKVFVSFDSQTISLDAVKSIVASGAVPIVPIDYLTKQNESTKVPIAQVITQVLSSDRVDGLFTTLVVDDRGTALGLVYSSKESISEAIKTGTGVYQSRKRGLWYKGATSGAVQKLLRIEVDCDSDCVKFVVDQTGLGFCHLDTATCFGSATGISALERTLKQRLVSAPAGSYTKRLFDDEKLLSAKIMEEAEELTQAETKSEIAFEFADVIYFAMTKAIKAGVSFSDVEKYLDSKAKKITRRKGDAKPKWASAIAKLEEESTGEDYEIKLTRADIHKISDSELENLLKRPAQKNADIMSLVKPIIDNVRARGDSALIEYTERFEKARLTSPVLKAPFDPKLMVLDQETIDAIDLSYNNVKKFHEGQLEKETLVVETSPGVVCSRFARPIESVGLYVPGGTAILPSTALMLGVPALVAGCKNIVIASPPRADGTPTPEVVYVAHKVGASAIVLAGGAQAVAAMAYGTESVPKVNKILGPGNQFVTAAKMIVQNDTSAIVSIDMPAGPSEVLVIADKTANPSFVASDLLSQAEHGVDSQVILIAIDLNESELNAIEKEVHEQAMRLPRVEIVKGAIHHSRTFQVKTVEEAFSLSNRYAPEHLILQVENANKYLDLVQNAGSVFVGPWSPESCGDYSSGTNHTLPTYGYARVYSGVNTHSFMKHLTSQELTPSGLQYIGPAVVRLATVEGLDAHGNAVRVRLEHLKKSGSV
ncbi:histidinol dehydrogenase-domain-containing protein [Dipodascopsis uninucleata]